jgi:deoxyribonuclease IV
MVLLGAHESVSGGLHLAFDRIRQAGGDVLQIFTRNQRQWNAPVLTVEEIASFRIAHQQSGAIIVASHASYLVNLASGKEDLLEKSVGNLSLELERCAELGIPFVVLHPGAHGGDGIEAGLNRFIGGLDLALGVSRGQVQVLVETTAGQGTGLGSRFEELAYILANSRYPDLLGVCVDTCHVFAAGYELRSPVGYEATIAALANTVGLSKVRFFHLNDSKNQLGSRVDRHEHIGKGTIGLDGFGNLLRDSRFADLPMILETPKGENLDEDRVNLQTLRALL